MDGWLINNYPPIIRQKYLKLTPGTGLSFVLIDAGAAVQSLYRKQANFEKRAKSTSLLDRITGNIKTVSVSICMGYTLGRPLC